VEALLKYKTFVRPMHAKDEVTPAFFLTIYRRSMSIGSVEQMLADVGKAAGIPRLHPHLLRHTSATEYLANGGDVISVQRKLGHSRLTMTDRCVHLASDQAAAQERVAPMDRLDIKPMRVAKAR